MRGSTPLEGSGMVGEFEGGVDKGFVFLLVSVSVILSMAVRLSTLVYCSFLSAIGACISVLMRRCLFQSTTDASKDEICKCS